MTPTKTSRTKQKFSLVPVAAQRRIYELAFRATLVRELLGIGAESHTDFSEIGALTALQNADPIIPSFHSVGSRIARAHNLAETASAIEDLRHDTHVKTPAQGLSQNNLTLMQVVESLIADPDHLAVVSVGELKNRAEWEPVFRFVGRHRIPILFIVAAHYYSRRETSPDLRTIYAEFGIPVITTDAYDAIAAFRVATEAAHNAKAGRGATVLESTLILTPNREINSQAPLDHLEEYMQRHGSWDDAWREQVEAKAREELKLLKLRTA